MFILHPAHAICDARQLVPPGFQARRERGLDGRFFLEDEGREEGDDFFGRVWRERVFEYELCED